MPQQHLLARVTAAAFLAIILSTLATSVAYAAKPSPTTLTVPVPPVSGTGPPTEEVTGIAAYIKLIYTFGTGFGILLAVGVIVFRGIQYTVSELIPSKEEAIKGIQAAVIGLLLLLGANVILYLINPSLLNLQELGLGGGTPAGGTPPGPGAPLAPGTLTISYPSPCQPELSWNIEPSAGKSVKFFVQVLTPGGTWDIIASQTESAYTIPASYPISGKPEKFRVIPLFNATEEGTPTNEVLLLAPTPPDHLAASVVPTGKSLADPGAQFNLSWTWNPNPGPVTGDESTTGFRIEYRAAVGPVAWLPGPEVDNTTTDYTFPSLPVIPGPPSKEFRVVAINSTCDAPSQPIAFPIPPVQGVTAPTITGMTPDGTGGFTLSWTWAKTALTLDDAVTKFEIEAKKDAPGSAWFPQGITPAPATSFSPYGITWSSGTNIRLRVTAVTDFYLGQPADYAKATSSEFPYTIP